ncbi:MAG TPA: response regulator transcription factor [Leptolyngbya sp.]|jgi:DNA-binding NarL/FixJ family response regulator|nr:response regulator transcription factor [Leptolyngbya sp.]
MNDIRITLIEDHDLTRVGMRTALQQRPGFQVIGEAANGIDGLKMLTSLKPDVAIVDIGLPDIDGIELTRRFRQAQATMEDQPDTKVLILTLQDQEETVLAAFAAGADSYCMKDVSLDQLVDALRVTQEGNSWIDPAIARVVLRQTQSTVPVSQPVALVESPQVSITATEPEYNQIIEAYPLTERELEVLQLIVDGCSNAAIAEKLYITVGTVKTHVRNILNKLCADDRTQAAVRALRSGLVG